MNKILFCWRLLTDKRNQHLKGRGSSTWNNNFGVNEKIMIENAKLKTIFSDGTRQIPTTINNKPYKIHKIEQIPPSRVTGSLRKLLPRSFIHSRGQQGGDFCPPNLCLFSQRLLGGGFKYFLFSSLLGEDEPILTNIFPFEG